MKWNELKPIWRIIVCVSVADMIGTLIGFQFGPGNNLFVRLWFGGAICMFPGFICGLVWQFKSPEKFKSLIPVTLLVGSICLIVGAGAYFFVLPMVRCAQENVRVMKNLSDERITKIDIYDENRFNLLKTITDKSVLEEFGKACGDVEPYSPNHPKYSRSWYIIVYGNISHEYDVQFLSGDTSLIKGNFVKRNENKTYFYGSFSSRKLRPWFDEYALKP